MTCTVSPFKKTTLIACTLALGSTVTLAQEIELSARDGSSSLRGQLIEFVDQKYTIDTSIGRMTIDSDSVLCSGEACPFIPPSVAEFSVISLDMMASRIIPELLPAYARSIDAQITNSTDGSYVLTNAQDEEIAIITLSDSLPSSSVPDSPFEQAAIVLASQPLLPEEALKLSLEQQFGQSAGNSQVLALDAITVITSEFNPISAISIDDVVKVFSGEYSNWSELGGPDAPITLYGPQPDSGLAKSFEAQILNTSDDEQSRLSQDIFFFDNVAERVASNPNAIGYAYFSNSQPAKTLDIQGVCGIATPANSFTIKAEEYPLTRRLNAYSIARTNVEQIDALLSFMQSDAGQDIMSSNDMVNQLDTSQPIKNQGIRFVSAIAANTTNEGGELLGKMVAQIIDSERLSTTFRFETGFDQLDERALFDIVRLAENLQSPENADSVIHLIGFTDAVGDFELNQEVSVRRANQVRDALIEIDTTLAERVSILPAGFGEIAPVACNETAQGRSMNRRVEVWMN